MLHSLRRGQIGSHTLTFCCRSSLMSDSDEVLLSSSAFLCGAEIEELPVQPSYQLARLLRWSD